MVLVSRFFILKIWYEIESFRIISIYISFVRNILTVHIIGTILIFTVCHYKRPALLCISYTKILPFSKVYIGIILGLHNYTHKKKSNLEKGYIVSRAAPCVHRVTWYSHQPFCTKRHFMLESRHWKKIVYV